MNHSRLEASEQGTTPPAAGESADSDRQMTLWPVPGDGTERRLQRPRWHRTSPLSRQAARRAEPRAGTRQADVLALVRARGRLGATRDEVSEALGVPVHALCAAVRHLLDCGDLVETALSRPTRLRRAGAVLIAREAADTEGTP